MGHFLHLRDHLEIFTNSKEKFIPQGTMMIQVRHEGKGRRYSCRTEYTDVTKKLSLITQKTFRENKEEQVFEEAILACLQQLKRFRKEKIEICVPYPRLIERIKEGFRRGKSPRTQINECIQLLRGFKFFIIHEFSHSESEEIAL